MFFVVSLFAAVEPYGGKEILWPLCVRKWYIVWTGMEIYEGNRFGRKQPFILKIRIWNCKLVDYEGTVQNSFWG